VLLAVLAVISAPAPRPHIYFSPFTYHLTPITHHHPSRIRHFYFLVQIFLTCHIPKVEKNLPTNTDETSEITGIFQIVPTRRIKKTTTINFDDSPVMSSVDRFLFSNLFHPPAILKKSRFSRHIKKKVRRLKNKSDEGPGAPITYHQSSITCYDHHLSPTVSLTYHLSPTVSPIAHHLSPSTIISALPRPHNDH